jgi:hypothetical protein
MTSIYCTVHPAKEPETSPFSFAVCDTYPVLLEQAVKHPEALMCGYGSCGEDLSFCPGAAW